MIATKLATVLSEFARTLITDFSIQDILDELVERVVEVLPVAAAGVTLIAPGMAPHFVAASDGLALRFERLQTQVGQGPCLLAYEAGLAVLVPDLRLEDRFPLFVTAAVDGGLAAVFTFPLRHGDGRLGALDLYRTTPGALSDEEQAAAQTLADVAAAYLLNAQARESARETSDQYRLSALHDLLTGLPNRTLLQQRLDHAVERARRSHAHLGVLFVDLDQFKRVNDTFGHETGDALLCAVADRLGTLIRHGDTLARLYGDEFVFICEGLSTAGDARAIAERVEAAFAEPFTIERPIHRLLQVSASVGLAYAGLGEEATIELLVNADIAMYQAKRRGGGGHQIIDLRDAPKISDRINLHDQLTEAFDPNKLNLAFQPIIEVPNRVMTGVEALLRWAKPDQGPMPSHTMVDVAEQNGLNTGIGAWVLNRACTDRHRWLQSSPRAPLDVCVNVSRRQLMNPGFSQLVANTLAVTATDPAAIVLEFADDNLNGDADRAHAVLAELRSVGVRLALDNVGAGHSSLSNLIRFPLDVVKIDRSLVATVERLPKTRALVEAITNLAHTLGQLVTAVGVETELQHEAIASLGCDNAQGYLYARPMPQAAMTDLLASRGTQL